MDKSNTYVFGSLETVRASLLCSPLKMREAGEEAAKNPDCLLAPPPAFDFEMTPGRGKLEAMLDNGELWFLYKRYLYCTRGLGAGQSTQKDLARRDLAFDGTRAAEIGINVYVSSMYAKLDPAEVEELLFESPELIVKLANWGKRQGPFFCLKSPPHFDDRFDVISLDEAKRLQKLWRIFWKYLCEVEAVLLRQGQLTICDMENFEFDFKNARNKLLSLEELVDKLCESR